MSVQMLLLIFFVLFGFSSAFWRTTTHVWIPLTAPRTTAGPGPQVRPSFAVMKTHMHTFEGAVRDRNEPLILRLINLSPVNSNKVAQVYNTYQGYSIRVTSAIFEGHDQVTGVVSLLSRGHGRAVVSINVVLRRSANSPTGWIIAEEQQNPIY
ncbi:unnamed protein product [Caenorhabditis sp. 36 PRJEB53466]|nr:unnamed protein product [Caenorhabditis sp. 36 PRJEB53466]